MQVSVDVSFVLAVYNVSEYLKKCIDSIVCEDGSYELLLIDDGSTDDSGSICDEYEKRYSQVKSFHKDNGGLSDARNYGLRKAKGKYVFFVDSDDYLPDGAVKTILNAASEKNSDVIVWNCSVVDENNNAIEYCNGKYTHPALKETKAFAPRDFIITQLLLCKDFPRTVWLGMYRREFLLVHNVWFERILLHEDELWTPKVYLTANEIFYINDELYCYKIRANSIMNKLDKDYSRNLKSITYIYNELPIFYDYYINDTDLCRQMKADVSKRYLSAIAKYKAYKYPQIAKGIRRLEVLKNAGNIKDKIRAMILVFNVKAFCLMNNGLKKWKPRDEE